MNCNRLVKLSRYMRKEKINKLIVASDLTIFYLTGHYINSRERLHAVIIDESGGYQYLVSELFDVDAGSERTTIRYSDGETPMHYIRDFVKPGERIAVENGLSAEFLIDLMNAVPEASYLSGGRVIAAALSTKDCNEEELMLRSSQINDLVVEELIGNISASVSELELSNRCQDLYAKHGADSKSGEAFVAYGANCASPHHNMNDTRPKVGDSIIIDAGASYQLYNSDMTRTVFFKDISSQMEKIYHTVLKANLEGIAAVCAGARASEVDNTCRSIIAEAGYGDYFIHRTGHGIGLNVHEMPYIEQASQTILENGMIFSVEPGIYIPNLGGVRIEDLVVVNGNGAKNLNTLSKELMIVG